MSNQAGTINSVANVALIIAMGALGSTVYYKYFRPRTTAPTPIASKVSIPFQPGQRAPLVGEVNYASRDLSLIVFISTTCRYCEGSVPFYNRLQEAARASNYKWRIFTVFWQDLSQVEAFKARVSLRAETVAAVDFRNFGVHSTPTTLLVGRDGVVKQVWLGASESNESSIAAALTATAGE